MPIFAVLLIVVAAFTHASWNILAKRASGCRHFNWYYSAGAVVLWMPLALFAARGFAAQASYASVAALAATSVLHALYSAALMRGYRVADLSIVYPVARAAPVRCCRSSAPSSCWENIRAPSPRSARCSWSPGCSCSRVGGRCGGGCGRRRRHRRTTGWSPGSSGAG
jgi:hypothetical protein